MLENSAKPKKYKLMGPDGQIYESETKGEYGGNRSEKIYGKMDCKSANRWLGKGYERYRVFFADEATAIAAGYRPCGNCMRERYNQWKAGEQEGVPYPWRRKPKKS
jgi:hypothetical protein